MIEKSSNRGNTLLRLVVFGQKFKSYEVAFGGMQNPSGVPIGYAQQVETGNPATGQRPKPYLFPALKRAIPKYKKELRQSVIRSWEKSIREAGIGGGWKVYGALGSMKWITS